MIENVLLLEQLHPVMGLAPVADGFSGTVYSDIVNLAQYDKVLFLVVVGVGSTGASTLTVEISDDVSASNVTAVPFRYRAITTGDTEGAVTAATATGFVTTAGSAQIYMVEVSAEACIASGRHYCRLKAVEAVNDPILVGILIFMGGERYGKKSSAIV